MIGHIKCALLLFLLTGCSLLYSQDIFVQADRHSSDGAEYSYNAAAQTGSGFTFGETRINTLENLNRLIKLDPELKERRQQIERFIDDLPELLNPADDIPLHLAFHVLYRDDAEKITEDQIDSQLKVLNEHFGKYNDRFAHPSISREGYDKIIGEVHINFELSDQINRPITYTHVERGTWEMNDDMKSDRFGGVKPVSPETVINIWVVNLGGRSRGYAQMPGSTTETDGIVIDYRCLGVGGSAVAPTTKARP